jgi:hypothetical protein
VEVGVGVGSDVGIGVDVGVGSGVGIGVGVGVGVCVGDGAGVDAGVDSDVGACVGVGVGLRDLGVGAGLAVTAPVAVTMEVATGDGVPAVDSGVAVAAKTAPLTTEGGASERSPAYWVGSAGVAMRCVGPGCPLGPRGRTTATTRPRAANTINAIPASRTRRSRGSGPAGGAAAPARDGAPSVTTSRVAVDLDSRRVTASGAVEVAAVPGGETVGRPVTRRITYMPIEAPMTSRAPSSGPRRRIGFVGFVGFGEPAAVRAAVARTTTVTRPTTMSAPTMTKTTSEYIDHPERTRPAFALPDGDANTRPVTLPTGHTP